jgi:hypothetical protein
MIAKKSRRCGCFGGDDLHLSAAQVCAVPIAVQWRWISLQKTASAACATVPYWTWSRFAGVSGQGLERPSWVDSHRGPSRLMTGCSDACTSSCDVPFLAVDCTCWI